jgi:ankyrin repeat protein
LWYLSFEKFKKLPFPESKSEVNSYCLQDDFLGYSARNWFTHFNGAENIDMDTKNLALITCDVSLSCFRLWFSIYWEMDSNSTEKPKWNQTLFTTAYFGLESLTAMLLEQSALAAHVQRPPIPAQVVSMPIRLRKRIQTILRTSKLLIHKRTGRRFFDYIKSDFNLRDSTGRTPLIWSAERGHEAVVKLLLKAQVDTNILKGKHSDELCAASIGGHEAVVKILLEAQADVNTEVGYYGNALCAASVKGHEAVVKILLEAQADVNTEVGYYGNALCAASVKGHGAVVKILLEAQADVNAQGDYYSTALCAACENGHSAVVKLLLNIENVETDSKNNAGKTPLSLAAECGNEFIVKLLLDTGKVDINSKDKYGRTPLSLATRNGRKAIVKLLLEKGADEDMWNRSEFNVLEFRILEVNISLC